ncbi:hypothetical protein [Fodinicola feengrottensis]|uniref:hypothetical protein n=1 Tax=Fodinicola feengrottensis TaxID=435914 RepID=UPI0036F3C7AA
MTPDQLRQTVALQQTYHDAVRDVIVEGCTSGAFATEDVELTTMAILDMLNGVREWFRKDGRLTRDELVARYQRMIARLLHHSSRIVECGTKSRTRRRERVKVPQSTSRPHRASYSPFTYTSLAHPKYPLRREIVVRVCFSFPLPLNGRGVGREARTNF